MKRLYDVERFWRVYHTVRGMLNMRGYTVHMSGHDVHSFEELQQKNGGAEIQTVDKRTFTFSRTNPSDTTSRPILIQFCEDDTIGIKQVKALHYNMNSSRIFRAILIHPGNVTPAARKYVENELATEQRTFNEPKRTHIEMFAEDELYVNIMKHERMPKFRILPHSEKVGLLKAMKCSEGNIARLPLSDPVARYLGLHRGQMVQIFRRSETAGLALSYRVTS